MAAKPRGVKLRHSDGERTHVAGRPGELHTLLARGYSIDERGLSLTDAIERLASTKGREPAPMTETTQINAGPATSGSATPSTSTAPTASASKGSDA